MARRHGVRTSVWRQWRWLRPPGRADAATCPKERIVMQDLNDSGLTPKHAGRKTGGGGEPASPSRRSVLRVAAGASAAGIAATALSGVVGGLAAQASTPKGTP